MSLLLNELSGSVMEDTENMELLNAFFSSVFTVKATSQESQTLEVRRSLVKGRLSLG